MRITGGAFRSRLLSAPKGLATRPTTDRVREALFSILASRGALEDARVLDAWAGTGALGLEALSRGAARATFVESARPALAALRGNIEALGVDARARVLPSRVEAALPKLERYELVLCDPPWDEVADLGPTLAALGAHLVAGGTLVLEHASRDASPEIPGLSKVDARRYGDTAVALYRLEIVG